MLMTSFANGSSDMQSSTADRTATLCTHLTYRIFDEHRKRNHDNSRRPAARSRRNLNEILSHD